MEEQEAAEHNAVAWLSLTDEELIERSGSLDLPAGLTYNPNPDAPDQVKPTQEQINAARNTADAFAREHAGDAFVDRWIAEVRGD